MLQIIRASLALLFTSLSAYLDHKSGEIPESLTLPMILLGILLSLLEGDLGLLVFPAVFSAFLVPFFFVGYLGGGDVLLFSGLSFLLPYMPKISPIAQEPFIPFPLLIFLISGLLGVSLFTFVSIKKLGKKVKVGRGDLIQSLLLSSALLLVLFVWLGMGLLSIKGFFFLLFLTILTFLVYSLRSTMIEQLFLKEVSVEDLEPEDVVAVEFAEEKVRKYFKLRRVVLKKDKEKLKSLGVSVVPVLTGLPRFGPVILVSLILCLIFGDIFVLLIQ